MRKEKLWHRPHQLKAGSDNTTSTQNGPCRAVTVTSFRANTRQESCVLIAGHRGNHAFGSCKTCDAPSGQCAFGKHRGN